jgi:hypothetical protein
MSHVEELSEAFGKRAVVDAAEGAEVVDGGATEVVLELDASEFDEREGEVSDDVLMKINELCVTSFKLATQFTSVRKLVIWKLCLHVILDRLEVKLFEDSLRENDVIIFIERGERKSTWIVVEVRANETFVQRKKTRRVELLLLIIMAVAQRMRNRQTRGWRNKKRGV